MNTPVKVKKARQMQPGTPIPASRRKENTSPTASVYNPPVSKLKKNYDVEFDRFLRSAKTVMDYMEISERDTLSQMRKQMRRLHKESNNLDVYFKSQAYWKFFYKGLLNRCDDVMDCFRFDDLRPVFTIIETHHLPEELVSFVTQQLMEWRELFKDVEWMKAFGELSHKVETLEQERKEHDKRLDLLREIGLEMDVHNLKIQDFKRNSQTTEQLSNSILAAIQESKKRQDPSERLKNVPIVSKRMSVKRWYRAHYDPMSKTASDNESDEESSSDDGNSSLFVDTANSNADDAVDLSTDEADNDNDFDSFFTSGTI